MTNCNKMDSIVDKNRAEALLQRSDKCRIKDLSDEYLDWISFLDAALKAKEGVGLKVKSYTEIQKNALSKYLKEIAHVKVAFEEFYTDFTKESRLCGKE